MVTASNPIITQTAAQLSVRQQADVRRVVDGMVRERSDGSPGAVLPSLLEDRHRHRAEQAVDHDHENEKEKTMTSTKISRARYGAVAVATAPLVMALAFVAHPFIARVPDAEVIAAAVDANRAWWVAVHLLTVLGTALTALAFVAIRAQLRDAGEDRYSAWALPWVLFGTVLYGFLPGLEFTPVAVARTGGDVAAAQDTLTPVFLSVLVVSGVTFAIGAAGFAKAVMASGVLSTSLSRVVATALILLAISRLVPLGAVQFYVQAAAGLVALWPLANDLWRGATPAVLRHATPAH